MKNSFFWFVRKSLEIDWIFFHQCSWTLRKKTVFLLIKYKLLIQYILHASTFSLGESSVVIFGKRIYYGSYFGIAEYQSMLTRHQFLLELAQIKHVDTIVDVGANVGLFSMMIHDKYPKATLIAIEPAKKIFYALEKNLSGMRNVILLNTAVTNKAGKAHLVIDLRLSATSKITEMKRNNAKQAEIVSTERLDTLLKTLKSKKIDILKIDVETFEKEVLLGAIKTLARTRYLFLEITIENNDRYTFTEINSLLFSKNYNFQLVAFRNYADISEGRLPLGDFLYKNILL